MTTETVFTLDFDVNAGAQWDFVVSEEPFPAFMGGQGSGKTAAGVLKMMRFLLENPGARGVITEPIYSQIQDALMPVIRTFYGQCENTHWWEEGKNGPNHQLRFQNGSLCLLKASEAASRLVGFEAACALMDEAGSSDSAWQEMAYLNLIGRLRQKGYRHWLGVTTTPAGFNWLWREWVESPVPGHVLFHGSTYENKENLPDGYIERMAQAYGVGTPRYKRLIMGEFVRMEGQVLTMFDPGKHILPIPQGTVITKRLGGIDFGVHSPTAVVEARMTSSRHVYLTERLYRRDCRDDELVDVCGQMRKGGVSIFYCDPSAKDRIAWLRQAGVTAIKAKSNRLDMRVGAWTTRLSADALFITPDSPNLIQEATGLAWAPGKGKDVEMDRFDPNTPDHAFDAGADVLQSIETAIPIGMKPPELKVMI